MKKSFIHPEIQLNVTRNKSYNTTSESNNSKFEYAKEEGRKFANEILESIFSDVKYGKIESHFNTERLNSDKFSDIRENIIYLYHQRNVILNEGDRYLNDLTELQNKLKKLEKSLLRFLLKKRIKLLNEQIVVKNNELIAIREVENESYLKINFRFDDINIKNTFSDMISAFTELKYSDKIWDMTYSERNFETKSAASTTMERTEVKFNFDYIKSIQSNEKSFCFENYNGGDFYFYPSFIIYFKNNEDIAIIDYSELIINFSESRFLEESADIPSDTKILGKTWYRVNKDGTPDRRFTNNYEIPIVCYGSIQIQSISGINELYYISDVNKAKHFCEQYHRYQDIVK